MKKSRSAIASRLYSPHASLAALGVKLRSLNFFDVLSQREPSAKWRDVNKRSSLRWPPK